MMEKSYIRLVPVGIIALGTCLAVTGCSSQPTAPATAGNASEGSTTAEITFWDPYSDRPEGSPWDQLVKSCAPEGSTITRTSAAQTDLFNQLTTAVKEGTAPDIAVLDNPMMPDAVDAGMVATAAQVGIDVDGIDANLLGPGIVDGVAYGVPFGSNALGLYYNQDILDKAQVDPASITDWDSLNAAIEKVVASGAKGISFSGVTGEDGTFQFLPWYWGAGANLDDITSDAAISAGQLRSDWVGKGWAPKSVLTDNPSASWDLFMTGEYGFTVNGSWYATAAADASFKTGVIPIPAKDGGVAPVPTGGEFAIAPIQEKDASDHYANAAAVIDCLTAGDAAKTTSETLGYLSARADVRAEQVKDDPIWTPWVDVIEGAQGRTTDLGAEYVTVSGQLSEAIQGSLNAAGDPERVKEAFLEAAGN